MALTDAQLLELINTTGISATQARTKYGVTDLPDRIMALKDSGVPIITRREGSDIVFSNPDNVDSKFVAQQRAAIDAKEKRGTVPYKQKPVATKVTPAKRKQVEKAVEKVVKTTPVAPIVQEVIEIVSRETVDLVANVAVEKTVETLVAEVVRRRKPIPKITSSKSPKVKAAQTALAKKRQMPKITAARTVPKEVTQATTVTPTVVEPKTPKATKAAPVADPLHPVVSHIQEHGFITPEDASSLYGVTDMDSFSRFMREKGFRLYKNTDHGRITFRSLTSTGSAPVKTRKSPIKKVPTAAPSVAPTVPAATPDGLSPQHTKILGHIDEHGGITTSDASALGIKNLRARIAELNKNGQDITSVRQGKTTRYQRAGGVSEDGGVSGTMDVRVTNVDEMRDSFVQGIQQIFAEKGFTPHSSFQGGNKGFAPSGRHTPLLLAKDSEPFEDELEDDTFLTLNKAAHALTGSLRWIREDLEDFHMVFRDLGIQMQKQTQGNRLENLQMAKAVLEMRRDLQSMVATGSLNTAVGGAIDRRKIRDPLMVDNKDETKAFAEQLGDVLARKLKGTDIKGDRLEKDTDRSYSPRKSRSDSSGSSGFLLGSLAAAGIGVAVWQYLLSDEQKENIKKLFSDAFREYVIPMGKEFGKKAWEGIKEEIKAQPGKVATALAAPVARGAQAVAGGVASGARMVGRVAKGTAPQMKAVSRGLAKGARYAAPAAGAVAFGIDYGDRKSQGQTDKQAVIGATSATVGGMIGYGAGSASKIPFAGLAGGVAGSLIGGALGDMYTDATSHYKETNVAAGSPTSIRETVFNYFINKGLSKEQAAGITGNLAHETGGFRSFVNRNDKKADGTSVGLSSGIAQWNQGRLDRYRKMHGGKAPHETPITDQLDFLWMELNENPSYGLKELRSANNVGDATRIFEEKFERPAAGSYKSRVAYAKGTLSSMSKFGTNVKQLPTAQQIFAPKTGESIIPHSSVPLANLSHADSNPAPVVVIDSSVTAPQVVAAPAAPSGPRVSTVRDSTNSFVRNADKHSGFNFFNK